MKNYLITFISDGATFSIMFTGKDIVTTILWFQATTHFDDVIKVELHGN